MPKGSHFKKQNPRNIQCSFKVNKKEKVQIEELMQKFDMKEPQMIRRLIEIAYKSLEASNASRV
jgi:hypothetical protein